MLCLVRLGKVNTDKKHIANKLYSFSDRLGKNKILIIKKFNINFSKKKEIMIFLNLH